MTPQQLAEKYVKDDASDLESYTKGRVKRAFIKGYEAKQSVSIEKINTYGKYQHDLGSLGLEFVSFDEWMGKP